KIMLAPRLEGAVQHFDVPVPDFTFSVYPAGQHELHSASAEVLLAIDGELSLVQEGASLSLQPGQSAFVPAVTGCYRVQAKGRFARAGNG
ncbi:mannose-6-phosphate isomerase, partial [Aeromonas simiae]|nr:mannose-6-phosphate isomerase [Aeromonas simiae]MDO2957894.1 mannose-6-phosphate isomerase [Aeromonas simiae]